MKIYKVGGCKISMKIRRGIFILAGLVTFVLMLNFGSAMYVFGQDFRGSISGLTLSSNLTINKIISLCEENSCTINTTDQTVAIRSFYDPRVALVFSITKNDYDPRVALASSTEDDLTLTIVIPYDKVPHPADPNRRAYIERVREINPENYSWGDSIETDLTKLKELGVLDIQSRDINEIALLISSNNPSNRNESNWFEGCERQVFNKKFGVFGCAKAEDSGEISAFPILPLKEFALKSQIQPLNNKDSQGQSSTYTYVWIVLAVFIIAGLFFFFKTQRL